MGVRLPTATGDIVRSPLKRIGLKLTPQERLLHDLVISLRQTVYAHSDESFAHARLDIDTAIFPDAPFAFSHFQFDHSLEFASFYKREAAIILTKKIMHGLFKTVQELGMRQPEKTIYVQPATRREEPDWKDIVMQNVLITVLTPPESDS